MFAVGDGNTLSTPYLTQPGHITRTVQAHNATIARFEGISPLFGAIYHLIIQQSLIIFHTAIWLNAFYRTMGNGMHSLLQFLHRLEEIEKPNQSIHHFVQKCHRSPMAFHSINHSSIEAHSHIIREHLAERSLATLHFLLVLDIIDSSLREGAHLHVPHVVMAYCSIHPQFYQIAQPSQMIPRHLWATRAPPQTPAEVISRPDWQNTYHYR